MSNKTELISDTQVGESGPALDIRTSQKGKTVALAGKIPLIHYGGWGLTEAREITDDPTVREIITLARELIEKAGSLQDVPAMGNISIQLDSATRELIIKAARPILHIA